MPKAPTSSTTSPDWLWKLACGPYRTLKSRFVVSSNHFFTAGFFASLSSELVSRWYCCVAGKAMLITAAVNLGRASCAVSSKIFCERLSPGVRWMVWKNAWFGRTNSATSRQWASNVLRWDSS